jgi:hypothetical protein
MKTYKLLVIVAIICLLAGLSSGVAMAEGCGDGLIQNETFSGNLRITNDSCTIIGSTIEGNLRILNSKYVVLLNNKVGGNLRVDGNAGDGVANVVANTVFGDRLVVRDMEIANVIENETLTGDIRVVRNVNALVQKNIAAQDLRCNNTTTDAFFNFAGGAPADCE